MTRAVELLVDRLTDVHLTWRGPEFKAEPIVLETPQYVILTSTTRPQIKPGLSSTQAYDAADNALLLGLTWFVH